MGTHPIFESDFDCLTENARSIDRMVKRETKSTNLDRPWEEMVQAVIQKYPNPHSKTARVSDILSRSVNAEGHVVTERYSGNKFPVPGIISSTFHKFTGIRFPELAYSYEYSVLDCENKVLTQYSKNYTMGSFLSFVEVIEYRLNAEGNTSMMVQNWNVKTMINSWIDGWFESQLLSICKKNASDGISGIKWVADMRADAPLQLDEFRDQLKIHIGEISEKVVELCTVVEENVGEIIDESIQEIEHATGEITKKVAELCTETADNVEEVVEETTKRFRHYSEPSAARSGSRNSR